MVEKIFIADIFRSKEQAKQYPQIVGEFGKVMIFKLFKKVAEHFLSEGNLHRIPKIQNRYLDERIEGTFHQGTTPFHPRVLGDTVY